MFRAFFIRRGARRVRGMSGTWQPPLLSSKTAPSVSTSYDLSRCQATQKLKSVCLCDACKGGPDLKASAEQDEAWAAKRRAEKFAELDEVRRSSETAPGGGSSLAAAAAAARAEMPASTKAAALAARFGGAQEKCAACSKTVYAAERITAKEKVFHRECFRCEECNAKLGPAAWCMDTGGHLFCKTHFMQLLR